MLVTIAIISGILNSEALILIFSVNVIMNVFGFMMEKNNQSTTKAENVDWLPFIAGSLTAMVPWIIISTYYFTSITNNFAYFDLIKYIIPTIFILWLGFPLNMYLHYKRIGALKDYINSEKGYIMLGLVTKTLLAWQILLVFLLN